MLKILIRDGYEFRVLQILGKKLNFTYDIVEPLEVYYYG